MRGLSPARAARRAVGGLLLAAATLAALSTAAGCGAAKVEVQDPPYVEKLRVRISKVRHAIDETRQAIALSRGAPYLAELYLRLGELLSEEARYHYQVAYEREQRASHVLHAPQVRFLKEQAIIIFRRIIRRYPGSGLVARALFNIGHEQRELGEYDEMLKTLGELVDEHPKSPLTPEALLVLGDYWFDKGELEQAESFYQRIVKGPESRVEGLAHYKLAWVALNRTDCKRALRSFDQAIDTSRKWAERAASAGASDQSDGAATLGTSVGAGGGSGAPASAQSDIDVRREALVDAMYCFARERKPSKALPYLKKKAYNRATFLAALGRLAARYDVLGEARGAIDVTRQLLTLAPTDPDRLDDARMLYTGLKKEGEFRQLGRDVRLITEAMRRQVARVETTDEMRALVVKEFEQYTRDLITRAQAAMQKGKVKPSVAREIARGYEEYLAAFPGSEATVDMVQNLADVLSRLGDHADAGLRYAQAADLLEDDKARGDALYDAVVEFQKSMDRLIERKQVERVVVRAALRRAGARLLKRKLPGDKQRTVKLAMAQTYYDEGRFREAIDRFLALAYEYPRTQEAKVAVHLVLDSYNTLNDYEAMIDVGHRLMGSDSPLDPAGQAEVKPIVLAAEKRKLDELSLAAAGEEGGDLKPLEEFAKRYQGTELGERAMLNAFVAARAIGDSDKLYSLGEKMTAMYPKSDQLPGVIATLAKNALATFDYDRAIGLYKQAAQVNPDQKGQLLTAAGEILEQLGDTSGALKLYQQATAGSEGGAKQDAATRLAGLLERLGDDRKTVATLAPLAALNNGEVLARLGLAQVRLGQSDAAEMSLQRVIGGEVEASPEAAARAQYGMAESLMHVLETYKPGADLDSVQEFAALIEVTEQGYLNAARQGSPLFTPAALSRLAYMASQSADRLAALSIPSDLAPDEAESFKAGLAERVKQLRETSAGAMKACADQAWTAKAWSAPVLGCLSGRIPAKDPVVFERLRPRRRGAPPQGVAELQAKLAKNPDDLETLRALGERYLDAGDPHMARMVFARVVQSGGGPEDQNLFGIASFKAGDVSGALDAFSQAADGGLEAGRRNLAAALRERGLGAAAKAVMDKLPEGKGEGRAL